MSLKIERRAKGAHKSSTAQSPGKRPYKTPQLANFGNVAKLTKGVGGSNNDPGQGNLTKVGNG